MALLEILEPSGGPRGWMGWWWGTSYWTTLVIVNAGGNYKMLLEETTHWALQSFSLLQMAPENNNCKLRDKKIISPMWVLAWREGRSKCG